MRVLQVVLTLPLPRGDIPLLVVWKNALELFVWNKNAMNPDHEFALIVLTRGADWVRS